MNKNQHQSSAIGKRIDRNRASAINIEEREQQDMQLLLRSASREPKVTQ